MKLRVALFLILVCLSVIVFSCRRNPPSLVDANRAPDTELWYAPPDSTEYDYLVHLYWRGIDLDGVAQRFIWTVTDTVIENPLLRWNPSERLADYRRGRITSRTDSVFAFEAFTNVAGVGLRKNRQAFHVAAIDDNGVIDPTPAVIEFIATVGDLPEIRFATTIRRSDGITSTTVTKAYDPAVLDTVGMLRPFWISYHGLTVNGLIREYLYYPLSTAVVLEGQDIWSPDLSDTLRFFPNIGEDAIPSGVFRFVAQCKDDAAAESRADVKDFEEGVVQVVVNFEPDTELLQVVNTYFIGITAFTDTIDFEDGIPDTVPFQSWVRLWYRGWDSPYDSSLCNDDVNECIGYQVQYERDSDRIAGASSRSRWLPDNPEDNNDFGTTDSTSMNIGSVEYTIRARAVDGRGPFPELGIEEIEYVKADGTPPEFEIIGNYDPTLESAELVNYDGTVVGTGDTIVWDWWNPARDTIIVDPKEGLMVVKEFFFDINAIGHDHPTEDLNFGVQGWFYLFNRADDGAFQKFGRARAWVEGPSPNVLSDRHKQTYRYSAVEDPDGRTILDDPPEFWDSEYEFSIFGRDIGLGDEFEQFMFVNEEKRKLNSYQSASLGRWTETATQTFYLKMVR